MPPKKKKKQAEEDDSTEKILKIYSRKIGAYNTANNLINDKVEGNKNFKEKVNEALDDQDHLTSYTSVDIDKQRLMTIGIQFICETLSDLKYKHLKEIRIYKQSIKDEGCKHIADFMKAGRCVKILVLPDNEITAKGCTHLGSVLGPNLKLPLTKLKLDFNEIGTEGLKNLTNTLCSNDVLERLSLNFCGIESDGSKYLQDILGFDKTQLWSLKLKGNFLRNEGTYQLFRALETNTILNKLVLSNNQFGESDEIPVIPKICEILTTNTTCYYYDFTQNAIYDKGARDLLECVKLYKTVWRMELPDIMAKEIKDEFKKVLKKRKKPKKKKKKKGKGKKKKKK